MSRKSKTTKIAKKLAKQYVRRETAYYAGAFDSGTYSATESLWLYKLVYRSKKAFLVVLLLCATFVLQPLDAVYAEEIVDSTSETPAELSPEAKSHLEEIGAVEENTPAEIVEETLLLNSTQSEDILDLSAQPAEEPTETVIDETEETASSSELVGGDDTAPIVTPTLDDNLESNDEATEDEFISNENLVSIVESDTSFSFNKNECTKVEGGSFYCQKRADNTALSDALVSLPDADGDLEIYLIRDGKREQITKNLFDDASPAYDEYSNTIVWHRLIDDRYQIMSYDLETREETQLTNSKTNNMEPTRHGDYIVWQRWLDNNWEIVLYDGQDELRVTNSTEHDVAPHIRGPLIIWNSQFKDGSQTLKTYDLQTNVYTTIEDAEGVSVGNPRMMVMYEALYENGDVVMKGFDIASGKIVPLQALPQSLPENIPDSDTTGETRALIQSKPSLKQEIEMSTSTLPGLLIEPDIDDGALDLRTSSSSTEIIDLDQELDELTLVVPDIGDTATSSQTN